jgi:eukaryotic-like serine/threonine-protein kinase
VSALSEGRPEKASWELEEGAEIAPSRSVLRHLGGGSAYEAYLVWDERLFAIAVAKVVRPDQVEDGHTMRGLRQEAELAMRLAHPVIVRAFDAVLHGPHPHLLLEHLEGPSLRRLIRKGGPLGQEQLLPLALHVAAALHYLEQEEVVHLDVKPDNIIMGVPPRLIDLSVARSFERAARISGTVGTDSYMAPEQCDPASHPGRIGPRADVFGLACTVYHALTGHKPFPRPRGARDAEDPRVRFPQLWQDPRPLPERVPGGLADLLLRGLAKEPEERPSAAEFALGLQPLVDALPRKLVLAKRGARFR